jgi:hypothetical protein
MKKLIPAIFMILTMWPAHAQQPDVGHNPAHIDLLAPRMEIVEEQAARQSCELQRRQDAKEHPDWPQVPWPCL